MSGKKPHRSRHAPILRVTSLSCPYHLTGICDQAYRPMGGHIQGSIILIQLYYGSMCNDAAYLQVSPLMGPGFERCGPLRAGGGG